MYIEHFPSLPEPSPLALSPAQIAGDEDERRLRQKRENSKAELFAQQPVPDFFSKQNQRTMNKQRKDAAKWFREQVRREGDGGGREEIRLAHSKPE